MSQSEDKQEETTHDVLSKAWDDLLLKEEKDEAPDAEVQVAENEEEDNLPDEPEGEGLAEEAASGEAEEEETASGEAEEEET
ncbi:MAG: hypothetical protein GF350_08445, partial [Chitinivibrionales bacterium]|nr:hypothetical protein [Chitinivibrionales bacterium]